MWRTLSLVESLDTASGRVFACPFIKSCNRSFQCLAEFYEGVFDAHRRLGKDTPHYRPTSFKLSQALRELFCDVPGTLRFKTLKRALPSWLHNALRVRFTLQQRGRRNGDREKSMLASLEQMCATAGGAMPTFRP